MNLRGLLVVVALLAAPARGQSPGDAPDPDAPFRLAVESWVARHRRPGVSFVHVLGPRATGAIEAMAADRYRVRELGAAVLASLPEGERVRALAWGAAHPSAEVRARCRAMLAAMPSMYCYHCGEAASSGRRGTCPTWRKPGVNRCSVCNFSWICKACPSP